MVASKNQGFRAANAIDGLWRGYTIPGGTRLFGNSRHENGKSSKNGGCKKLLAVMSVKQNVMPTTP